MIYVDNAFVRKRVGRLDEEWSHLIADTPEELHEFAVQKLKLRRLWAHCSHQRGVHYDVTQFQRLKAIRLGARPITVREVILILRRRNGNGA